MQEPSETEFLVRRIGQLWAEAARLPESSTAQHRIEPSPATYRTTCKDGFRRGLSARMDPPSRLTWFTHVAVMAKSQPEANRHDDGEFVRIAERHGWEIVGPPPF
jgi:hypothetical protein